MMKVYELAQELIQDGYGQNLNDVCKEISDYLVEQGLYRKGKNSNLADKTVTITKKHFKEKVLIEQIEAENNLAAISHYAHNRKLMGKDGKEIPYKISSDRTLIDMNGNPLPLKLNRNGMIVKLDGSSLKNILPKKNKTKKGNINKKYYNSLSEEEKIKLDKMVKKAMTFCTKANTLLICLNAVKKMGTNAVYAFFDEICKTDIFLAVTAAKIVPNDEKKAYNHFFISWLSDKVSNRKEINANELLAIVELQDGALVNGVIHELKPSVISSFYQMCPCSLGCKLLRFCYMYSATEILNDCEFHFTQMMNRYDTDADNELKRLISALEKKSAYSVLNRIIEIIGENRVNTIMNRDISHDHIDKDLGQEHENKNFDCTNLSIIKDTSSINESDYWYESRIQSLQGDLKDKEICKYIDFLVSKPDFEEKDIQTALKYCQKKAFNKDNVFCWLYLSILEKHEEYSSALQNNDFKFSNIVSPIKYEYVNRIVLAIEKMLDNPEKLSCWIDSMGRANPFSFELEYRTQLPDISKKNKYCYALKHLFDINTDVSLIVKLYLYTPIKSVVFMEGLLERAHTYKVLDKVLDVLKAYRFFARTEMTYNKRIYVNPVLYVGKPISISLLETRELTPDATFLYRITGYNNNTIYVSTITDQHNTADTVEYNEMGLLNGDLTLDNGNTIQEVSIVNVENLLNPWRDSLALLEHIIKSINEIKKYENTSKMFEELNIFEKQARQNEFNAKQFISKYDLNELSELLLCHIELFSYLMTIVIKMGWNREFTVSNKKLDSIYFIQFKKYQYKTEQLFKALFDFGHEVSNIVKFYFMSIYKSILPFEVLLSYSTREKMFPEINKWQLAAASLNKNQKQRLTSVKCTQLYQIKKKDYFNYLREYLVKCIDYAYDNGAVYNILFEQIEKNNVNKRAIINWKNIYAKLGHSGKINEWNRFEMKATPPLKDYFWNDPDLFLRCSEDLVILRKNLPNDLLEVLNLLGENNPLNYNTDNRIELYYLRIIYKKEKKARFKSAFISFILNAETIADITKIYFSTCLRFYISINEFRTELQNRRSEDISIFDDEVILYPLRGIIADNTIWSPYLEQNSMIIKECGDNSRGTLFVNSIFNDGWNVKCDIESDEYEIICKWLSCLLVGYRIEKEVIPFIEQACLLYGFPFDQDEWLGDSVFYDDILSKTICYNMDTSFCAYFNKSLVNADRLTLPKEAFFLRNLMENPSEYFWAMSLQIGKYKHYYNVKERIIEELRWVVHDGRCSVQDLITRYLPNLINDYLYTHYDSSIVIDISELIDGSYGEEVKKEFITRLQSIKGYRLIDKRVLKDERVK